MTGCAERRDDGKATGIGVRVELADQLFEHGARDDQMGNLRARGIIFFVAMARSSGALSDSGNNLLISLRPNQDSKRA
jgi:hypothetical protein